jgi:uncharacterized protein (DUF302 family)
MIQEPAGVCAPGEPTRLLVTIYNLGLMAPIKILIVDDHPIMRMGIAALISSSKEMECVGQAGSGEEAIKQHGLASRILH